MASANGIAHTEVYGLAPLLSLVTIHGDATLGLFYARQLAPTAWGLSLIHI